MPEADPRSLEAVPDVPGVYVIWPVQGPPHLGRTSVLRRRLTRLARVLGEAAARIEYYPTGSPFESALALYRLARRYRRRDYRTFLRLKVPPFLKVNLANPYPRCHITRRLGPGQALYFGPFTTRVAAERFQSAFLDLFLMRRCREEIRPDPAHPGCIYGEMNMCLRPCQGRASQEDYRAEVGRAVDFLSTQGKSLIRRLEAEREQASEALEFERAARLHRKLEKVREALRTNEELARDVDRLFGVVVQRSAEPGAVELWFLHRGCLQARKRFSVAGQAGEPVSLDRRLRELIGGTAFKTCRPAEKAELLGLLVRWWSSSWKTGELLLFEALDQVPYRRLVRAVSRIASDGAR